MSKSPNDDSHQGTIPGGSPGSAPDDLMAKALELMARVRVEEDYTRPVLRLRATESDDRCRRERQLRRLDIWEKLIGLIEVVVVAAVSGVTVVGTTLLLHKLGFEYRIIMTTAGTAGLTVIASATIRLTAIRRRRRR